MWLLATALACNGVAAPPERSTSTGAASPAASSPPADAPRPVAPPSVATAPEPVSAPISLGATVDPAIIAAAEAARGTAEGKRFATERLRAGVTGDALWAAVYVYSTDGDDPTLLEPLLTAGDATIRVLAAGGLLRMGEKSGFPALIAETANPAILAGSEPPQSIGEIAALMLAMASGEGLDITPSASTKKAWSDWYAAHRERLKYDPHTGWSAS